MRKKEREEEVLVLTKDERSILQSNLGGRETGEEEFAPPCDLQSR